MLDIRAIRESLNLTQEEFAKLIDERQDVVSRIENNSGSIQLPVLIKISKFLGITLDQLMEFSKEKPKVLDIKDNWSNLEDIKNNILNYFDNNLNDKEYLPIYKEELNNLKSMVINTVRKPKIAVIGHSDSGKSTLINSLLGDEKLPTNWTPTTSINIHIKHIDDKPEFVKNNVCIYKLTLDGKDDWNPYEFNNESYHNKWLLEEGDLSTLHKCSSRFSDEYIKYKDNVGSAIIYVDSDILKVCDIVDLPGFGTGDRELDDKFSLKFSKFADIVIYMSVANSFLHDSALEYAKNVIKVLKPIENKDNNLDPLSNLFIVASQAHIVSKYKDNNINTILTGGSKRLFGQIPIEEWKTKSLITGYEYTCEMLEKRFFTYSTDSKELRIEFENSLIKILEEYPIALFDKFSKSLGEVKRNTITVFNNYLEELNGIINQYSFYKETYDALIKNESNREKANKEAIGSIIEKIKQLNKESIEEFQKDYDDLINADSIVKIINENNYTKKKKDIELLAGYLSSKLEAKLNVILQNKSMDFAKLVDSFLEAYEANINDHLKSIDIKNIRTNFDAKRAFASSLAGMATFGALAVWASTLGNLGAYILVAKGVSLLTAIGISIEGGVATAVATVSTIGGPVVLGIALALLASISTFALVSSTWKITISKKIVKAYAKENALDKYNDFVNSYWFDTIKAFIEATEEMDKKYKEYLNDLYRYVSSSDSTEVKKSKIQVEEIIDFINNLPVEIN